MKQQSEFLAFTVVDSWFSGLQRAIFQGQFSFRTLVAEPLAEGIFGAISSALTESLLASSFGDLLRGFFGNLFGALAGGSTPATGHTGGYMVGRGTGPSERLGILKRGELVVPQVNVPGFVESLGGGGGSGGVQITVQSGATVDEETLDAILDVAGQLQAGGLGS